MFDDSSFHARTRIFYIDWFYNEGPAASLQFAIDKLQHKEETRLYSD